MANTHMFAKYYPLLDARIQALSKIRTESVAEEIQASEAIINLLRAMSELARTGVTLED